MAQKGYMICECQSPQAKLFDVVGCRDDAKQCKTDKQDLWLYWTRFFLAKHAIADHWSHTHHTQIIATLDITGYPKPLVSLVKMTQFVSSWPSLFQEYPHIENTTRWSSNMYIYIYIYDYICICIFTWLLVPSWPNPYFWCLSNLSIKNPVPTQCNLPGPSAGDHS